MQAHLWSHRACNCHYDLVEHFKVKKGLEVMCQKDGKMIFMFVMPKYKSKLGMKMRTLLSQQDGETYRDLVVTFRDEDGEQVKNAPVVLLPTIQET